MEPIYLLDLAARKTAWLAARQEVVATNVANANTPGYHARDVAAFKDILAQTQLTLASTDSGHLQPSGASDIATKTDEDAGSFDVSESGNTVEVEGQMTKVGNINREYALTTNIVKSFHNLLMASLKG